MSLVQDTSSSQRPARFTARDLEARVPPLEVKRETPRETAEDLNWTLDCLQAAEEEEFSFRQGPPAGCVPASDAGSSLALQKQLTEKFQQHSPSDQQLMTRNLYGGEVKHAQSSAV